MLNVDVDSLCMLVVLLVGLGIVRGVVVRLCKMSEYAMRELSANAKMVMAYKASQGDVAGLGPALLKEVNKPEPQQIPMKPQPKNRTCVKVSAGVQ